MIFRSIFILVALFLSGFIIPEFPDDGATSGTSPAPSPVVIPTSEKHRGVSWVAGNRIKPEYLNALVDHHINWIVQTPFGWQRGLHTPAIALATTGNILWGETDAGLTLTAKMARQKGIHTLLKPHIWVGGGKFRGDIRMENEEDWQKWFDNYRTWILHYARLAAEYHFEGLCIGTELRSTVREREKDWRGLIRDIRKIYSGKLTYAANWYAEFEEVPFWDMLDFIGIQAYFPLTDQPAPSLDTLVAGWKPHADRIKKLSRQFNKPVIFTEIGYRTTEDAAHEPWTWPQAGQKTPLDPTTQARCYEAFFRVFWDQPWFAGAYWWKWFPNHEHAGGVKQAGFTPQNKSAATILTQWYGLSTVDENSSESPATSLPER